MNQQTIKIFELYFTDLCYLFTVLFPKYSPFFKCLVINKRDGSCISNFSICQADLSNHTICLDPIYGVIWAYNKNAKISCYNLLATEMSNLLDQDIDGKMSKDEEKSVPTRKANEGVGFRNQGLKSIFNAELCIPIVANGFVSRSQAAINLLCCLDTLNLAQDLK